MKITNKVDKQLVRRIAARTCTAIDTPRAPPCLFHVIEAEAGRLPLGPATFGPSQRRRSGIALDGRADADGCCFCVPPLPRSGVTTAWPVTNTAPLA